MTPFQLAWAAGFVDGEGYIGVERRSARCCVVQSGPRRGRPRVDGNCYRPVLSVVNRNRVNLERLQDLFGGVIREDRRRALVFKWQTQSTLHTVTTLQALIPYLVGKQPVAANALAFGRWYLASAVPIGVTMPPERRQLAEWYYRESRRLIALYRAAPGGPDVLPASAEDLRQAAGGEGDS